MIKIELNSKPFYLFENFQTNNRVFHFVTTRNGGVSLPPYASLNLGIKTLDNPHNILINRSLLSKAVEIPLSDFVFSNQTHSDIVTVVDIRDKGKGLTLQNSLRETDALITNEKNILLFVFGADCVSILLYDTVNEVIAAVHAGWQGTVKKIVQKTIQKMTDAFGTNPENIIAGIGPSSGVCCYEIGQDVETLVNQSFATTKQILKFNEKSGKNHLDLWESNRVLLIESGVKFENIEISKICTQCNSHEFFSSRVAKGVTGRFGAGIMMK